MHLDSDFIFNWNNQIRGWITSYTSGKVKIDNAFDFGDGGFETDNESKFTSLRIGAKGGYQWLWGSGFVLDLNLGLAYTKFSYENSDSAFSSLKASGILPTGSLAIGYSF